MKPTLQLEALVNTFWTTWNILKLWYCKEPKSGQDEVTNGDKVTSKLDVVEFRNGNRRNLCRMLLQKSQARESSNDAGVFSKASSVIKQERSECLDGCCDCHSPPAFLVHPSEVWVFQHQITTPAAHWKPWLLHVDPNQLELGQDSSCPPVLSDTRPYSPRKHDVQGTFKAKSLHEPTTWTSYPCDIEIISKTRWSEPELGKLLRWACRDGSSFLNLLGNNTVFSARDLAAFEAYLLFNFAWSMAFVSKKLAQTHVFCCSLITINLIPIPFMWLHLASNHLKNIWSGIEMIKCHLYWIVRSESETELPQIGSNFTRSWLPCEVKGASAGW